MKTAAIAPSTSTISKATQTSARMMAGPAAPAATARRRGPRCAGALPSSRLTGRHRLRSRLKRRQPRYPQNPVPPQCRCAASAARAPTCSPKMPRDSTYSGARSNSGLHHHIASDAQAKPSSHQASALNSTNSGALASSQLPHTARAWRRVSAVPSSMASQLLRARRATSRWSIRTFTPATATPQPQQHTGPQHAGHAVLGPRRDLGDR